MSGGSFNYLCYAEPYELFNKRQDLADMVQALGEMGYVDAAKETETIALILSHFEARIQARLDRLNEVWKSVEWVRSGDSGPDRIEQAIADYRKDAGV